MTKIFCGPGSGERGGDPMTVETDRERRIGKRKIKRKTLLF